MNASGESSKSGIAFVEVSDLAKTIASLPRLKLRGLMAIPEPGAPRDRYREVRAAFEQLKSRFGFDTLSMGMSDDLELAVEEGAAIFGARTKERSAA